MQRIYTDGAIDLSAIIPEGWEKPAKTMNHRCPKRIITLINKIRSYTDKQVQIPRPDKEEGVVRLFLIPSDVDDKTTKENNVFNNMAEITGDKCWVGSNSGVKVLTLEHHMAARRMGFIGLFSSLDGIGQFKTGLRDGSLPGLRFFTQLVLPLIKAKRNGDDFSVCHLIRNNSPLLSRETLKKSEKQLEQIKIINEKVTELYALWKDKSGPRMIDILQYIARSNLFDIPDSLAPIANRTTEEQREIDKAAEQGDESSGDVIDAWDKALSSPFVEIEAYDEYVSDKARFGTHQGVKGLEFPRVMVILDDEEAGGFLFSYEKLFGAKQPTNTDRENEAAGKETSIDRTRRLFYVTCSRAKESLAIVAYTKEPKKVKDYVLSHRWLENDEVVMWS
jgi:DNA helicase II / ATP-dependent DNA helicase PcrA